MINPIIKENTMQAKTLILSTLSLLLFACDAKETPQQQKANNAQAATTPQNTATQQNSAAPSPTEFTPSANDISNLAKAMGGGAAGIMPDDAPKDKYGNPYIIGNLGGVPVNLPASVVEYVEYEDSPGFNPEALRNFKPSVRNYDSVLTSFGFEFRNRDAQFYDRKDNALYAQQKEDFALRNGADWIDVSVSAGKFYGTNPDALTSYLKRATDRQYLEPPYILPFEYHELLPEKQYGLEVYASPGIDPETQTPWRQHEHSQDVFVQRNAEGKVITYISCSNKNVRYPPCTHDFNFPNHMRIRVSLNYSRKILSDWQKFEENTIQLINSFQVKEDNRDN